MLSPRDEGGFSLLEVMVAIGILGLSLTVILSAQGGLAASNKMASNMGLATTFGRCKMTEMEEKLLKLGYPLVDDLQTDVPCCNDREEEGFLCDTRVEKVVLPNPPQNTLDGGAMSLSSLASASPSSAGSGGISSALSQIAPGLGGNAAGGPGLDFDGGLQGLGQNLMAQVGGGGGMGAQGLLQMVMGMVYPMLKPLYEASIRRLTVTVKWKEGPNKKELALVQYVTSPQQAGFQAGAIPSASAGGGIPLNGNSTTTPISMPTGSPFVPRLQ
ncbi:MAG TPA: prepilin-type N-terminal cleavage/methylation domain-containing protein [Polyangiaceae bacterium]